MRLKSLLHLAVVLVLLLVIDRPAFAQSLPNTTRLLRFPTTNGSQIVFCYAGQLYTVPKEGGIARRLTSGPGYTSFSTEVTVEAGQITPLNVSLPSQGDKL